MHACPGLSLVGLSITHVCAHLGANAQVGLLPVGDFEVRRLNQNVDDGNSGTRAPP